MAIAFADRVKDTTTTTGTGNITLSGTAPTGFQSFNSGVGVGPSFSYAIIGGSEWEVGQGLLSGTTTLVRSTVQASSNAGAAVNFSAGTKDVFLTVTAADIVAADDSSFHFGDGSDGVMPSGAVTLTRDMLYTTGTPIAGDTMNPAGHQLYFSTHLDLSNAPAGWITKTGAAGGSSSSGTGGTGGAAVAGVTAGGGTAGVVGGAALAAGTAGVSSTTAIGGSGGGGGVSAGAGGAAAAASTANSPRYAREALLAPSGGALLIGGLGGAGGGGGGTAVGGGGGGGGAPVVVIRAKKITRGASTAAGAIALVGGAGGNAHGVAGDDGSGGGGGGGGAGAMWIHAGSLAGVAKVGAVTLTGGAGGSRNTSVNIHSAGGTDGTAGAGGSLYVVLPTSVSVVSGVAGTPPPGKVTHVFRQSIASTTAGTSFVWTTFTPAVNDFLIVSFVLTACTLATPTVTDNQGGTYTKIASAVKATSLDTLYIYARAQAVASAVGHIITVDNTGDSATACLGSAVSVQGVNVYGASGVQQSAVDSNRNGTPAPVFGASVLAPSIVIGAVANNVNPATITVPSRCAAEHTDIGVATPVAGFESCGGVSGPAFTTLTWGSTGGTSCCAVAIEIRVPTITPTAMTATL